MSPDDRTHAPVGVFDSGVGGLSVLRSIREHLPAESLIYVADSRHIPYGDKSAAFIRGRTLAIATHLERLGCKAIVLACNTATAAAAAELRATSGLPVVAIEPAVKPAVAATRSGVVGVLATAGTLESARFNGLLARYAGTVKVVTQPCPGLVERIEAGDLQGPATVDLLRRYTRPLLAAGADTLVLGCTHYPFLRPLLTELCGPDVALIDTGAAVARRLATLLDTLGLAAHRPDGGSVLGLSSGDPWALERFAECVGVSMMAGPLRKED